MRVPHRRRNPCGVPVASTALLVATALAPALATPPAAAAPARATLRLYLARHGQTNWNAERRLQGGTDTQLDSLGRAQAAALAARLAGVRFDRVYCSMLSRSRETAAIVHGSVPIDSLAGLNEQRLGRFEGLRTAGSDTATVAEYRRRSADPDDTLDGGESLNQHLERVRATLESLRARHASGSILIVGHGGTNRLILRSLLGLTPEQTASFNQANDELYLIELATGSPPRLWKLVTEANLKDL